MVHKNYFDGPERGQKLFYPDNTDFNDRVDDVHDIVKIFDGTYKPSEVLFAVDLVGYKTALAEFKARATEEA